ncbi:MAG: hypothetical protein D6767_10345 [Candidatus Hydrogenedentota bacterium]|nr:MAG: hypothetical protein D6767_10345 [Candidatus Hydrogenedentota bacterium]
MSWIQFYFHTNSKAYRHFQIIYTILTLNFFIPAISYSFFPEVALKQFSQISVLLGAGPFDYSHELASRIWRYLGSANVMTLGFMCLLLQLNLKKFYPILIPLVFLKAYNATLFLLDFFSSAHVAFLAVALFDYLTSWAFIFFAKRAYKEITEKNSF